MDPTDEKSKMGSAILIAAAGALFGACVALFANRHQRKRKSSQAPADGADESLKALTTELDECRKTVDDFRLRLEQETERRNESEAWNRKLEQDLMDLAAARRLADEKSTRLRRDLDRVKEKLKQAETEGRQLKLQLLELANSQKSNAMPSGNAPIACRDTYELNPKIIDTHNRSSLEPNEAGDKQISVPANFCFTDALASRVIEDKISSSVEERFNENKLNDTPICQSRSFEDDLDDYYEDYSDEDEEEDLDDSEIAILQRSVSQVSDDNFELGKDVMGALIANAFKDGVIESRDGDDVSLSEEASPGGNRVMTSSRCPTTHTGPEQGEVSQESISDTKTTRRFWEQMIAADKLDEESEGEDFLSDEDNISEDYDDISDEEEVEEEEADRIVEERVCKPSKVTRLSSQNTQGLLSQGSLRPADIVENGHRGPGEQNGDS